MEKIHAFDVALAKSRQGLTDEQLLTRRRDAKRLLAACMPSLYSCHDLVVVEGLKAEDETLWMKVDIAISPQLTLNLDGKLRTPSAESTAFMRLAKELAELKRQAIGFSIRLGEIAKHAAILEHNLRDREDVIDTINSRWPREWEASTRLAGTEALVRFDDESICTQIPLIQSNLIDPIERTIRCSVRAITTERVEIGRIFEAGPGSDEYSRPGPCSLKIIRPPRAWEPQLKTYFMLYLAHFRQSCVVLTGHYILRSADLMPIYFQVNKVIDSESLMAFNQSMMDR